jgi:hypothetical protein
VCDKLIQIYPEILEQVHSKESENIKYALGVWDAFLEFNEELVKGCGDNDEADVKRHARDLDKLAEVFVNKFKNVTSSNKDTPYMHCMIVDIPRMVLRHGCLMKYSAKGVERLHQLVKFVTLWRSNKHHDVVGAIITKALTTKGSASIQMPTRRNGKKQDAQNQFVKTGGKMSNVARRVMEETKEALKTDIAERNQEEREGDALKGNV